MTTTGKGLRIVKIATIMMLTRVVTGEIPESIELTQLLLNKSKDEEK